MLSLSFFEKFIEVSSLCVVRCVVEFLLLLVELFLTLLLIDPVRLL